MAQLLNLTATTTLTDTARLLVMETTDSIAHRITFANFKLQAQKNTRSLYAVDYGAKFDGIELKDVTCTSGSAVISSASYSFTSEDVGKAIVLADSETTTPYQLRGTILSVSAGSATLSTNATASVSGTAYCIFGTDDTSAIAAAIAAANPEDYQSTGSWLYKSKAVIVFPVGIAMITSPLIVRPCISYVGQGNWATRLVWASTSPMAAANNYAMFLGNEGVANGTTRVYKQVNFKDFHIDMRSAFVTTYGYRAKCVMIVYMAECLVQNMVFDSSPATAFGCDWVSSTIVTNCTFIRGGRLWTTGTTGGGSGMDFNINNTVQTAAENALLGSPYSVIIANNYFVDCSVAAIRQSLVGNSTTLYSANKPLIANNLIMSSLPDFSKGIDDSTSTGAVIVGNIVHHTGTQTTAGTGGSEGQHFWGGICTLGGDKGLIVGNTISGGWYYGVSIRRQPIGSSTQTTRDYLVANNNISGSVAAGVYVTLNVGYSMRAFSCIGNSISSVGGPGIHIAPGGGGQGTMLGFKLSGNQIHDFGLTTATDVEKSGIYIKNPITRAMITDNQIFDSGGATAKYGITVDTGITLTDAFISLNDMTGVTTSQMNTLGTINGEITNNKGYHLGPATVTPGASPWTYTNGPTPTVLYISGGTLSSITKAGVSLPTSGSYLLAPNEAVVVTYTVAPTVVADKK